MIAVIFEVEPTDGNPAPYLHIAAGLIDELKAIDGFISVERFQSLSTPDKLLSLSFWRDEDAVRRWRTLDSHRRAGGGARRRVRQLSPARRAGAARLRHAGARAGPGRQPRAPRLSGRRSLPGPGRAATTGGRAALQLGRLRRPICPLPLLHRRSRAHSCPLPLTPAPPRGKSIWRA